MVQSQIGRVSAAGLGVVLGAFVILAAAHAQAPWKTYTDPQNRFTLQHPPSWPADVISGSTAQSHGVAIGIADAECKVFATKRPESEGKPADAVQRAYSTAISAEEWKKAADGLNVWGDRGVVTANGVDTSKPWPVQTAQFTTNDNKPGHGVMQGRPGLDVWMFCSSFDNTDRKATFDRIFASFVGTNDAALATSAAEAASQRAAAEAAAAAAAAEQAGKQKKKR